MEYFNPEERMRQKQLAREKYEQDIKMGLKTPEQVQKENSMLSKVNFKQSEIILPNQPHIGKKNGKLGIIKNNKMVYCIPDFLKVVSRSDLKQLLDEYKETGKIDILSIMKFESACKRR